MPGAHTAQHTSPEMDALIREGLPVDCASQVQARLALTDQGLADILALGTRTLLRLRPGQQAPFSGRGRPAGRLPARGLDVLLTEAGCQEVEQLLGRIEYGILA